MNDTKSNVSIINDFENLVDELMKDEANENQVKFLMEKLNLTYEKDSVGRITTVLDKMNKLVFESKRKKGNYDLR